MRSKSGSAKPDQFAELKGMIAKMMADMKEEQKDDDEHKKWCEKEFDLTEDATKVVQEVIDTHNQKIAEQTNELDAIKEAFAAVQQEIKDIDLSVLLTTAQRKAEKSEYDKSMSEITISMSLLKKARDKLSSFYEKASLTQMAAQPKNAGSFTQVETMFGLNQAQESGLNQAQTAGAVAPQSGAAIGILKMLDDIRADLKVEQKEFQMEEDYAVKDYEEAMADSKESKEAKEKDVIVKEGTMSRTAEEIQTEQGGLAIATDEINSLNDKTKALHSSCDFLLENYDIRKKARASEIEGLQKSVAILSGANFGAAASLLQVRAITSRLSLWPKPIVALNDV